MYLQHEYRLACVNCASVIWCRWMKKKSAHSITILIKLIARETQFRRNEWSKRTYFMMTMELKAASMATNKYAWKWIRTIFCAVVAATFSFRFLPSSFNPHSNHKFWWTFWMRRLDGKIVHFFFWPTNFIRIHFWWNWMPFRPRTNRGFTRPLKRNKEGKKWSQSLFAIFAIHSFRKLCLQCKWLSRQSHATCDDNKIQNNCVQRYSVCNHIIIIIIQTYYSRYC